MTRNYLNTAIGIREIYSNVNFVAECTNVSQNAKCFMYCFSGEAKFVYRVR